MRILFAVLVHAALLALVAAQVLNSCSPPKIGDKLMLFKQGGQTMLKCGAGIRFESFKTIEDELHTAALIGVNVESIASVDENLCTFFYKDEQAKVYKSIRDNSPEPALTFVDENKADGNKPTFSGPIDEGHKKFGTVVMNGCSLIITRVGTSYYVSHPGDGFTIRREITGSDGAISMPTGTPQSEFSKPHANAKKRAIVTPVPRTFKDAMVNEDVLRNSHVWGQWNAGKLEVFVGQFINDLGPIFKAGKPFSPESMFKTAVGPTPAKLAKEVPPTLKYDHCYKVVISEASLEAEAAPPPNLIPAPPKWQNASPQKEKQKSGVTLGSRTAPTTPPPSGGNPGSFLQTRLSLRKRV